MSQPVIDLYDRYTHGGISRRTFLNRLKELVGSTAAASALLPLLANDYARAATVPPDDPRLAAAMISFPTAGVAIKGYLVRPKGADKRPAVIVIHENRGLNPHIEDVARRIALAGFIAFAPDMLSPFGGTPADEDQARAMFAHVRPEDAIGQLAGLVVRLDRRADSTGRTGAVGFCWGGGMVNRLAAASPQLAAGVSYYGAQVPDGDVAAIKAPLLLHYAGLDQRINAGIPAFRAALEAAHKTFSMYVYDGVNHGFNNDTSSRYDKAAADLAWERTIAFLGRHLR